MTTGEVDETIHKSTQAADDDTQEINAVVKKEESMVLAGKQAYELYKRGWADWNQWADENAGWTVNFTGRDFSGEENVNFLWFHFPGIVLFKKARFGDGSVCFVSSSFDGGVFFNDASFSGGVCFDEVSFGDGDVFFVNTSFGDGPVFFYATSFGDGHVSFRNASFGDGDVNFRASSFSGAILLDKVKFRSVPDFRQVQFGREISLHNTEVAYQEERYGIFSKKAVNEEASDRLRALRRMASEAKDQTREIDFFAKENRSKYIHDLNCISSDQI